MTKLSVWVIGLSLGFMQSLLATPQFARKYDLKCLNCHVQVPKLNKYGESFKARGYRLPPDKVKQIYETVPASIWLATSYNNEPTKDIDEFFLSKVELISGGPVLETPFSYFVEWRMVSLATTAPDTLQDRNGRFEDIWMNAALGKGHSITMGQFRALQQVDTSQRLSIAEPTILSTALPGDTSTNARLQSLRSFSPSGRSPGIAYQFQWLEGELASDGLFHIATLAFPGEFSIPLTPEAQTNASFELDETPKGLFLETFYRRELNSIGVHGIIDNDRWLVQALGVAHLHDFYVTGGAGVDYGADDNHVRLSLEAEYIRSWFDSLGTALGGRVEQITNSGREVAFIPYLTLTFPNRSYNLLLNLQGRVQEDNEAFTLELGTVF